MKKRRRPGQTRRDLQMEVGRLQQENEDLRAEARRLATLLANLNKQYHDRLQELQAENQHLQTLVNAGIKVPRSQIVGGRG